MGVGNGRGGDGGGEVCPATHKIKGLGVVYLSDLKFKQKIKGLPVADINYAPVDMRSEFEGQNNTVGNLPQSGDRSPGVLNKQIRS